MAQIPTVATAPQSHFKLLSELPLFVAYLGLRGTNPENLGRLRTKLRSCRPGTFADQRARGENEWPTLLLVTNSDWPLLRLSMPPTCQSLPPSLRDRWTPHQ